MNVYTLLSSISELEHLLGPTKALIRSELWSRQRAHGNLFPKGIFAATINTRGIRPTRTYYRVHGKLIWIKKMHRARTFFSKIRVLLPCLLEAENPVVSTERGHGIHSEITKRYHKKTAFSRHMCCHQVCQE